MTNAQSTVSFDYDLQVWIVDGIIQRCSHPSTMRQHHTCCNANVLYGRTIEQALVLLDTPAADGSTMRQKLGIR